MATITKRANGKWQVKCRRKGFKTQSKTFQVRQDAERWGRVVESEMDKGVFESTSKAETTIVGDAYVSYWKEVVKFTKSSQSTLYMMNQMKLILGHLRLIDLNVGIVRDYKEYRLTKVSGDSVRKELMFLSRFLKYAMREWQIYLPKGNPVQFVTLPPKGKARNRRLESNERKLLLQEAEKYGGVIRDVIEIAIETGMRRSEITRLEWQYLDVAQRVIFLPDTKNGDSRTVPLSSLAIEVISKQSRNSNHIFKIRGDSIGQAFRRVTERCGIEDLRFHDLRHEATSSFFELGLNIMEVSAITGHKDLTMLKRYTHLRPADLAKKLG